MLDIISTISAVSLQVSVIWQRVFKCVGRVHIDYFVDIYDLETKLNNYDHHLLKLP